MGSAAWSLAAGGLARFSRWDALLAALALAQGAVVALAPSVPAFALGLWWNANTISHNFLHRPFFRIRASNRLFSAYLSLLLGIPQSLWRDRHLAHHAGVAWRPRLRPQIAAEALLVLGLWSALAFLNPGLFWRTYAPGYLIGLGLCALHGRYEHVRGTVSHYGRLYNLISFNDGYHFEHHREPGLDWRRLPERVAPGTESSAWPAPLRWLERLSLEGLERLVLRSRLLQRFLLDRHRRAFAALLPKLGRPRRVGIVGGGLFPRTALIVRQLLPEARVTIIDSSAANLRIARSFLDEGIDFLHRRWAPGGGEHFDVLVIPLSFRGDRAAIDPEQPQMNRGDHAPR